MHTYIHASNSEAPATTWDGVDIEAFNAHVVKLHELQFSVYKAPFEARIDKTLQDFLRLEEEVFRRALAAGSSTVP